MPEVSASAAPASNSRASLGGIMEYMEELLRCASGQFPRHNGVRLHSDLTRQPSDLFPVRSFIRDQFAHQVDPYGPRASASVLPWPPSVQIGHARPIVRP